MDSQANTESVDSTNLKIGGQRSPPAVKKSIGVLGLASLAFFSVAGSPAGSEETIAAAGPGIGLLGFIIMPIIWSVPEALITAELSTTFPHNGGYVVWVKEAFSVELGYQEGLLKWISTIIDNAVYPAMMLTYCQKAFPELNTEVADLWFPVAVVFVLTIAQYFGLELLGVSSTIIVIITLLPFLVMVGMGIKDIDPEKLAAKKNDGPIDWGGFATNLFWNLNYWDSVSTLAAEVKDPARTFPRGLVIAVASTVLMYLMTLGVAIGTAPDGTDWDDSEFADAGNWIGGKWLEIWMVISLAVSCIGMYLADLSTNIFMLEGMANMGILPKSFSLKNRYGIPLIGLVVESVIVLVLVLCKPDMDTLVAWEMVSYCAAQVLEFAAFIKLRYKYPDIERPYKCPGGTISCIMLLVPATVFTVLLMAVSTWDVWIAGAVQVVFSYLASKGITYLHRRRPEWFLESNIDIWEGESAERLLHGYD